MVGHDMFPCDYAQVLGAGQGAARASRSRPEVQDTDPADDVFSRPHLSCTKGQYSSRSALRTVERDAGETQRGPQMKIACTMTSTMGSASAGLARDIRLPKIDLQKPCKQDDAAARSAQAIFPRILSNTRMADERSARDAIVN
jgi:hypothetical protein